MRFRRAAALSFAALLIAGLCAVPTQAAPGDAPSSPGKASDWAPGDKDGFGTSRTLRSKVWYTINDGELTEVFFPRIDTPATRDTQLVVSDGATFADREDEDTEHQVQLIDGRSPVYRQINTAKSGKYRITKTYVTDPDAVGGTGRHPLRIADRRRRTTSTSLHDVGARPERQRRQGPQRAAAAWSPRDGRLSSAVLASSGFTQTSSGYADRSDGWTDLGEELQDGLVLHGARSRQRRADRRAPRLTGLAGGQRLHLALGFGRKPTPPWQGARRARHRGFALGARASTRRAGASTSPRSIRARERRRLARRATAPR